MYSRARGPLGEAASHSSFNPHVLKNTESYLLAYLSELFVSIHAPSGGVKAQFRVFWHGFSTYSLIIHNHFY
jgi:hypothetical protein